MSKNNNPDALLARELGVRQLATNVFNYTVGSGIFALPAVAILMLGPAAPLAYLVCAVVIGLVVFCFADAGSRVSATGGPYAYVETAFGPMVGFIAGCLVFVTGLAGSAGVARLVVDSALKLAGPAPLWASTVILVGLIGLLVTINIRGVRFGARLLEVVTLAKLLPLLIFVGVGLAFVHPQNFVWTQTPDLKTVLATSGVLIFAFCGIEGAMIPSGEVKNPSRTVPRATFLALGAATLLYLAVQFVAQGISGQALGADKTTPLATAFGSAVGPAGRTLIIVGAVISMFGYLTANILSAPRVLFALSRDRFLPSAVSKVHPRFHTPHVSIATYGLLVAALAIWNDFERLVVFSNLVALMVYFLCAIAAWVLRVRNVRTDGEPFRMPGGPVIPILACVATAWLFVATLDRQQVIALLVTMGITIALYVIRRVAGSRPPG